MTTSEYFATEIYHQREKEMIQRLEWQRQATERAGRTLATPSRKGGWRESLGLRLRGTRHQPVRG